MLVVLWHLATTVRHLSDWELLHAALQLPVPLAVQTGYPIGPQLKPKGRVDLSPPLNMQMKPSVCVEV